MPNEKEVMGICEAVRLYLKDEEEEMRRTNRGTPRIPHYIRKQGLTPLAEVFRKRVFPRVTRALLGKGLLRPEEEMPWEWRLVTVLCYLLPGGARGFPFVLVAPCTRGASRVPDVSHDDDRIVEAGVALAAGWSRPPPAIGEPTWDGPCGGRPPDRRRGMRGVCGGKRPRPSSRLRDAGFPYLLGVGRILRARFPAASSP